MTFYQQKKKNKIRKWKKEFNKITEKIKKKTEQPTMPKRKYKQMSFLWDSKCSQNFSLQTGLILHCY